MPDHFDAKIHVQGRQLTKTDFSVLQIRENIVCSYASSDVTRARLQLMVCPFWSFFVLDSTRLQAWCPPFRHVPLLFGSRMCAWELAVLVPHLKESLWESLKFSAAARVYISKWDAVVRNWRICLFGYNPEQGKESTSFIKGKKGVQTI